jgi:hypothetical protein
VSLRFDCFEAPDSSTMEHLRAGLLGTRGRCTDHRHRDEHDHGSDKARPSHGCPPSSVTAMCSSSPARGRFTDTPWVPIPRGTGPCLNGALPDEGTGRRLDRKGSKTRIQVLTSDLAELYLSPPQAGGCVAVTWFLDILRRHWAPCCMPNVLRRGLAGLLTGGTRILG